MSLRSPSAPTTVATDSAGGKKITVRSFCRGYWSRNDFMNSRAVVGPLFIFQFAAITGRFMTNLHHRALQRREVSFPRETPETHRHLLRRDSCRRLDRTA